MAPTKKRRKAGRVVSVHAKVDAKKLKEVEAAPSPSEFGALGERPSYQGLRKKCNEAIIIKTNNSDPIGISIVYAMLDVDLNGDIGIQYQSCPLFNDEDETESYDAAIEREIEALLESGMFDDREVEDEETGKKRPMTDAEKEEEARSAAENYPELDTPYEVESNLWQVAKDNHRMLPGIPSSLLHSGLPQGFYTDADSGDKNFEAFDPAHDIPLIDLVQIRFLEANMDWRGYPHGQQPWRRGGWREMPEMTLAFAEIIDAVNSMPLEEKADELNQLILVWQMNRRQAGLADMLSEDPALDTIVEAVLDGDLPEVVQKAVDEHGGPESAHEFLKTVRTLRTELAWLKANPRLIHPLVRPTAELMFLNWKIAEKAASRTGPAQMTLEMEATRMNPGRPITERLKECYGAYGTDPEVLMAVLQHEGFGKEQLWDAAISLFTADEIDGPDLRAMTSAINLGPDSHMRVKNPKQPRKPEEGTPRERLAMALKNLDDVRIVASREMPAGASVYSPTERYLAHAPAPAPTIPMPLKQTSDTDMAMRIEMFEKERREHPDLPEEVIWQIVDDHMGRESRDNPATVTKDVDSVLRAFWEREEKRTGHIKAEHSMSGAEGVRDKVSIEHFDRVGAHVTTAVYELWDNEVARLHVVKDTVGHEPDRVLVSFCDAGYPTRLTHDRLNRLFTAGLMVPMAQSSQALLRNLAVHGEKGESVISAGIGGEGHTIHLPSAIGFEHIPHNRYFSLDLSTDDPARELSRAFNVPLEIDLASEPYEYKKMPTHPLEKVQVSIESVKARIAEYRRASDDHESTDVDIAYAIGLGDEYTALVHERDIKLRENPRAGVVSSVELNDICKSFWEQKSLSIGRHRPISVELRTGSAGTLSSWLIYFGAIVATLVVERASDSTEKKVYLRLQTGQRRLTHRIFRHVIETGIMHGWDVLRGIRFAPVDPAHPEIVEFWYRNKYRYQIPQTSIQVKRGEINAIALHDPDEAARLTGIPIEIAGEEEYTELPIVPLEEHQRKLERIEEAIMAYREEKEDFDGSPLDIATAIGMRDEYIQLLKERDRQLRENPCPWKNKRRGDKW